MSSYTKGPGRGFHREPFYVPRTPAGKPMSMNSAHRANERRRARRRLLEDRKKRDYEDALANLKKVRGE